MGKKKVGRPPIFKHKPGGVVLIKWTDGVYYYGKIAKILKKERKCVVVFDDMSKETVKYSQVYDGAGHQSEQPTQKGLHHCQLPVDATTSDVEFCMKCKHHHSNPGNELVFCDSCMTCYHQQCHEPTIPDETLEPDEPWQCIFCEKDIVCPYIVTQEEAMNALEVVPDKKNSMPTTAGRSMVDLKVTPAKRTSADKSSNSSLVDDDVAPSRKERSAPSSDNPKEESLKKKRKLAVFNAPASPPRNNSARTVTSTRGGAARRKPAALNMPATHKEDNGALVQIPLSSLTPKGISPSSPVFAAIMRNGAEVKSQAETSARGTSPTVAGPGGVNGTRAETLESFLANPTHDMILPPSPSLSDTFEEVDATKVSTSLSASSTPQAVKAEYPPEDTDDKESVIISVESKPLPGSKDQSSTASSAESVLGVLPTTCVVRVSLPYPMCLSVPTKDSVLSPAAGEEGAVRCLTEEDTKALTTRGIDLTKSRLCSVCSNEAIYLCSGCKAAWYCGPECQNKAWSEHMQECAK